MKQRRQRAILEIIGEHRVKSQEELISYLKERRIPATQATVSRDLRELQIDKVRTEDGMQSYVRTALGTGPEAYVRTLSASVLSMRRAENFVIMKTVSGMAAVASAAVDGLLIPGVLGTVFGADSVFVAAESGAEAEKIMKEIADACKYPY